MEERKEGEVWAIFMNYVKDSNLKKKDDDRGREDLVPYFIILYIVWHFLCLVLAMKSLFFFVVDIALDKVS